MIGLLRVSFECVRHELSWFGNNELMIAEYTGKSM